jgi:ribosomal protein S18 acetylase RimI-like enzyme
MTVAAPAATIAPLDHRDAGVAQRLRAVLVLAHAQEAQLLGVPQSALDGSSAADIQASDLFYLGALRDGELLGALVLGADDEPDQLRITTLVVHPAHQRQGIARRLVQDLLQRGGGLVFSVQAAEHNAPALALYHGLGFVEYRRGTIGALPLVKLRRVPGPIGP